MQITLQRYSSVEPNLAFPVVAAIQNWPSIMRLVRSIEMLTDGPIGLGARFRQTRIMLGNEVTEEVEVTSFERPRRLRITAPNGDLPHEFDYLIDATSQGGSRLTLAFRAAPANIAGKGVAAFASPFMEINLRDELEADLNDLARAVARVLSPASQLPPRRRNVEHH